MIIVFVRTNHDNLGSNKVILAPAFLWRFCYRVPPLIKSILTEFPNLVPSMFTFGGRNLGLLADDIVECVQVHYIDITILGVENSQRYLFLSQVKFVGIQQ